MEPASLGSASTEEERPDMGSLNNHTHPHTGVEDQTEPSALENHVMMDEHQSKTTGPDDDITITTATQQPEPPLGPSPSPAHRLPTPVIAIVTDGLLESLPVDENGGSAGSHDGDEHAHLSSVDTHLSSDSHLSVSASVSVSGDGDGEGGLDSASGEETSQEDSGEFVAAMLARTRLEEQGLGTKGTDLLDAGPSPPPPGSHRDEDVTSEAWRAHRKHVFVLSEAGKPIYSRYGSEEALSSTMGVMMALVSFVQSGDNTIRSIHGDEHTVVFVQQGPLVLVCVSSSGQTEQQLRCELRYVYHQIVSMLTQASIARIFAHKKNYDLRRLLAGSEKILDGLLDLLERDPSFLLEAVHCTPLASSTRDALSSILQKAITPNLVFSILIAQGQLVTIVQERTVIEDARLHAGDLHLLLNLVSASSAFQAGEIWTPICLPSFNPDCYFYAYVSYLDPPLCSVCLLLLSTDREAFYAVAECKRKIEEAMLAQNAMTMLAKPRPYSAAQVGVADLRHFMYKPFDVPDNHKQLTQFTSPEMESPYSSEAERTRLLDLYRELHGRIHSTSRPLKLIYHVAEKETLLAWVTSKFELYTCFSPLVTKASSINAITKLLRWIKREEERLFIRYPPKYSTTPHPSRSRKAPDHHDNATDNGFLALL
ncbi:vacuolar fusion protein MON1 homolog B [Engraulis encrasicolus]|uniref:vacuolar fusion protein MON1 homolog B n=1 Tax=Engraulis encrasicolus TaxID=184585 RepID=UPI002FD5433A